MSCKACNELVGERIEIHELYGNKSGYFFPDEGMPIKYCPVCGKKLKAESEET